MHNRPAAGYNLAQTLYCPSPNLVLLFPGRMSVQCCAERAVEVYPEELRYRYGRYGRVGSKRCGGLELRSLRSNGMSYSDRYLYLMYTSLRGSVRITSDLTNKARVVKMILFLRETLPGEVLPGPDCCKRESRRAFGQCQQYENESLAFNHNTSTTNYDSSEFRSAWDSSLNCLPAAR